ncbi:hypothetical protein SSX86_000601 [Deinandra increscens subsp. villosa]|uniref:Peptidase A1 domain-containing protein n=1 Tax=Deinandra increscens subsp. villosa TaxID=3103831 RepID=A0AAP0DX97_9ASTR
MNTLILLTLSLTISVSLSKTSQKDGGFTVDLIHIDSPLSPLYNPSVSLTDRLRNAFHRSMSRAFRLSKTSAFRDSKIEADIFGLPGEYIMKIQIGTPPVDVLGIADTGSDLTWAQCQPCKKCYKQVGPPFLVPTSSSTYHAQSCQSESCVVLSDSQLPCGSKNICQYKMGYGDGSYSIGDLATDTFWFGPACFYNVTFGCGHVNNGSFNEHVSGIVGLGGGPLSIINQLNSTIRGKFSYCLISVIDEASNQTSKIHFGDLANVLGDDVVSTPLVMKEPSTYYYVTLESVSVGHNNLSYKQSGSKSTVQDRGNIIVDSGTTLTFLPRELYNDLSSSLTKAISGVAVGDPGRYFEICYLDLNLDNVPTVTFRFTGADVAVPPVKMFVEVENGVSCLGIKPSDGFAIFGNLLQRDLFIGFDLVKQKLSFRPTNCSMH